MTMHIVGLPSFYPTAWLPQNGAFFQSHFQALRRSGLTVGVVYCEGRPLRQLLAPAQRARYRFQTALRDEDGLPTLRRFGWDTLANSPLGGRIWVELIVRTVGLYLRTVGRPDLLHAHQATWGGYAACQAARRYGIPCVITEHSHYYFDAGLMRRLADYRRSALTRADAVVAVSRALADAMAPYAGGRPITVIPNPVDTDFFTPGAVKPAGPARLLAVGRLTPEKRFDLLIDAFAELAAARRDATLTIIGEGPERAALEARGARSGAGARIALPGSKPAAAIRDALRAADALVLSSDMETFSVALVEAMAVGLPVVATACGGPEDIVTPETGLLTPRGDAAALARALHDVLRTPWDRARIRASAVERFSYASVAAACRRLYAQVLAR